MEQLDLTTPISPPAPPSITYYRIPRLVMDWDAAEVEIHVKGTNGERDVFRFRGANATAYMVAANKRNFTVVSLHKWTLNQLVSNGYLAGTVSGTPD